jgi:hypothetical protein
MRGRGPLKRIAGPTSPPHITPIRGIVTETGSEPSAHRVGCRHGSALLASPSLPARDHSARDLALSSSTLSDVEELLAERGLDVSYETVRRWVLKLGPVIAALASTLVVEFSGRSAV